MQKPELLAPAGSWEAMVAAVQNGADAVYLGGQAFNARASAANFDNHQLAKAVDYCHVRGVKVYVTTNIIIADEELSDALGFLHIIYNAGADAAILQDLGLAHAARQVLPELPLHASTQMTAHNTPGVRLLQQVGFDRIVLSRELSREGITQIKAETGADLEVFTHGALCVCYSGQCLMSSMIGGRSGNRGRCAQPCRMQYQLVDKWEKPLVDHSQTGEYLLSPRDLNLSNYIPQMIKAGVNSFKIEGRMKRPEYVATVIRIYRELIDQAVEEGVVEVTPRHARELEQIFNRDFTTGYFNGNPGQELMSYKRPNNRGVLLGRVKSFEKGSDMVELSLQEPLQVGDGIEVWVTKGGRKGVEVSRILHKKKQVENAPAGSTVWVPIPARVTPGDRVFKTHDAQLMQQAKASYTSSKEVRKDPLGFTVVAKVGQPLYMKVEDISGNTAEVSSEEVGQQAENKPLTREFLESQLNRLGNTPFALGDLNSSIEGEVMFPLRVINQLRRQVIEDLEYKRSNAWSRSAITEYEFNNRLQRSMGAPEKMNFERQETSVAVNVTEFTALKAAVDAGADIIYFGGESYRSKKPVTLEDVKRASELCSKRGVQLILNSPRILQDDELDRFNKFFQQALPYTSGVLVGNLGLLEQCNYEKEKAIIADFPINIFNRSTAVKLSQLGVHRATLSPEMTMNQVREFTAQSPIPVEAIVQGALPLMVTEYCAMGSLLGGASSNNKCTSPCTKQECGLKDRKGVVFPVEVDQYCHQHIFNSRELCLIDDVGKLVSAGVPVLRIDARIMDASRVASMVEAYLKVLSTYPLKEWKEAAALAKEELEQHSTGFTKGHYYRGIV